MKNKLQPTRTSFSRNFQCKKAPRWLSKFFHFGTENRADQLKKPPCTLHTIMYHFHLHPSLVSHVLNGLTIGGKDSSPSEDATKRAARSSSRRWKARKKQEIVFDILYIKILISIFRFRLLRWPTAVWTRIKMRPGCCAAVTSDDYSDEVVYSVDDEDQEDVVWPTRWPCYSSLALCIDHLSLILAKRRKMRSKLVITSLFWQ